uniref:EF-hand domain-containing protein n=1 Tax=Trypanosoma vivax (strain Y486) TaxID=1055687 RepID=G0TT49_TRYVY|nr:conserved hypothetical protein [Trypanosoma vivax Y486]
MSGQASVQERDLPSPSMGSDGKQVAKDTGKRLFGLLNSDSQERILRLLTAFRNCTRLEQDCFAQELGVTLPPEEVGQQSVSLLATRVSDRVQSLRLRDCNYVALDPKVAAALRQSQNKEAAERPPSAAMQTLVSNLLSADECLAIQTEDTSGGVAIAPEEANKIEAAAVAGAGAGAGAVAAENDVNDPVMVRNRSYQALRLARGGEAVAEAHYTKPTVLNVTGMPIKESDVWEWFDLLDVARNGVVGVEAFLSSIRELDRGFGTSSRAEAEFAEEVEALATGGQLTFEKFAYLVSRFPRF